MPTVNHPLTFSTNNFFAGTRRAGRAVATLFGMRRVRDRGLAPQPSRIGTASMIRQIPHNIRRTFSALALRDVGTYWERRYAAGGTSGAGSYGELAVYKADFLNAFVREQDMQSVIELGCGDGNQLSLSDYPRYLGLDVSKTAIDLCRQRFASDSTKSFLLYDPVRTIKIENFLQGDLTLSLDVIYHLVDDRAYETYLRNLFLLSRNFVVVYSSDKEAPVPAPHVRYRQFTTDVADLFPQFRLLRSEPNRHPDQSDSRFFVFQCS